MFGSSYTQEKLLALAGIASCADLIDDLATSGTGEQKQQEFFVRVFLDTEIDSSSRALQPNLAYKRGLEVISQFSQSNSDKDKRLMIYSLQIVQLMQQFMKRQDLVALLANEIPEISKAVDIDEQLLQIGGLYERSLSTLPFRIQIQGSQGYLRQVPIAQRIRGILFCAIRFALLWQQQGGSKFDFVFRKANIRQTAQQILVDFDSI